MQSLFFTNSLMLAAMTALAIPVLIHLLLKRRKKRVQFSTIRFFQQQDEQSSRRRKLRNWILLALRLLIVTLLVLAFARPYSRQNEAAAAGRKQQRVVFVLDRSASMLAVGTEGQRWTLAKERIQKIISGLSSDDSAALVECAAHSDVVSGFAPPATIAQLLRDLPPAYGTSGLGEGLQQALKLVSGSGHNVAATIYVVSDLQKSACRSISSCPLPPDVEVKFVAVGDLSSPNLAVSRFEVEAREGARPQVLVASFSDDDSPDATLDVSVDERRALSLPLNLRAGSSTNVDLSLPPLKPGWHDLKASLRNRDALESDNARYACLFVPEPTQVLVVEPPGAAHIFEQKSFFLMAALDPSQNSTNSVPGAFHVVQVAPGDLSEKLAGPKTGPSWNVVMLPALSEVPAGSGRALATFVESGGGLVLFLGEGMSANRYNSEFRDFLPARVVSPDAAPEVESSWRIAQYETNTAVFSAFRLPNSGDLRIPEFTKRYVLEPVEGASRLAFFDDGIPLVVTRAFGRGRVALANTSADTAWNDWPKHKTFVPFVHGLTRYVTQQPRHDSIPGSNGVIAGEDFDLDTGAGGRRAHFTLNMPDGKELPLTADDQGRIRDPGMTLPGTYSLRDKDGEEVRRLAVNLPPQESNLEALRPAEVQQLLVRAPENQKQTLAAGLFGSRNNQREFWTALLLGALVLLLVEPFVANRTSV